MGVPKNGSFTRENPTIKRDDLGHPHIEKVWKLGKAWDVCPILMANLTLKDGSSLAFFCAADFPSLPVHQFVKP